MANAKISALPAASTPLAGTEVLPIVQGGVTDQVSVANLTAGRAVGTGNLTVTGTGAVSGDFAINTNKFNVTAASGNTTMAGTLGVTGDVAVNTNKFNITASSGNTTTAGTLGVTGDFAINTNKFTVTASSGNTAAAGTLSATGDFAINTNKFNVTASSGNTTTAGTLSATGDFAVNTNKFTVTASSGNTSAAGTLSATGDFAINTNKFQVTASSGNTTVAGTLGVTGLTTATGGIAGGVQTLSGPGAVNVTTLATAFTSTGTGDALTLADGTNGQMKTVVYVAEAAGADTGVLTPTNRIGYASVTLNAVGDSVTLQFVGTAWAILAVNGATITP